MESLPLKELDFGLQKPTGPSSGVVASDSFWSPPPPPPPAKKNHDILYFLQINNSYSVHNYSNFSEVGIFCKVYEH